METDTLFKAPPAPPIVLRAYQQEAVDKIVWDMQNDGNSLCVVATGGGKSIIIAETVKIYNEPTLILQPTKEILEQNYEKLKAYVPHDEIGVYSASMDRKEINRYTFATIQSIYKRPEDFVDFGFFIIDEAHTLNPKQMTGMFMKFIKKINELRYSKGLKPIKVVGFTATAYRLDMMYVDWGTEAARCVTTIKLINRMKGFFWKRILINITMAQLIELGYLCAPKYIEVPLVTQAECPLNKSRSEFDMGAFDLMMESKKERMLRAVTYGESISKSVLVFCSSVKQATDLSVLTPGAAVVSGKSNKKERTRVIEGFKNGTIKTVFNVGVLVAGFDHPALDCIVLARPTRSIMLYVQMVGRGVRIAPGKTHCNVIDLTSTVKSLGRVETIEIKKEPGEPWDLISETGTWHARELYSFSVEKWNGIAPPLPAIKDGELPF